MCIIITKTKSGKEVERKGREGGRERGRKIKGKKGEKLEKKRGQKKNMKRSTPLTTSGSVLSIISTVHLIQPIETTEFPFHT